MAIKNVYYCRANNLKLGDTTSFQQALSQVPVLSSSGTGAVFDIRRERKVATLVNSLESSKTFIHLVVFEPNAPAAIFDALIGNDATTLSAPGNFQFIKGQLYLLCEGNHIVYVMHNGSFRGDFIRYISYVRAQV